MDHSVGPSTFSHLSAELAKDKLRSLEMAVQRAHEGLNRWQSESFEQLSSVPLSGAEITLLLLIGDGGRPISIKEMARLTNRVDIPNIQYSLRKLASAGLTCKQGAGRSGVSYSLTEEGDRVAAEMQSVRDGLLLQALADRPEMAEQLDSALAVLEELTGFYGSGGRPAGADSQG
ncbi:winged helix DNA-binding protein [Leisingera sp. JC11]|uniref:winged helix DNA-binding protein n=1 Tax=Leisingera sp. JC11 TaxID=3042469 RepID=UPI003455D002